MSLTSRLIPARLVFLRHRPSGHAAAAGGRARNRGLAGGVSALRRSQSAQGHSTEQPALPRPVLRRRNRPALQLEQVLQPEDREVYHVVLKINRSKSTTPFFIKIITVDPP